MSLQVGTALQDGIDDLTSQSGVLFVAVFVVLGLINTVISQSLSLATSEYFTSQFNQPGAAMQQPGGFGGSGTALALNIPLAVSGALLLIMSIIGIAVSIMAIRSFASESPEALPAAATRNLGKTMLIYIATSIIAGIAVFFGFLLLVIPGLILTVLFYFIQQEVALNDSGVIESIQKSIGLVTDNVVGVVALIIILFVLGILASVPTLVLPSGSVIVALVTAVFGQVISVFNIAVVTSAYQQAAGERTETAI